MLRKSDAGSTVSLFEDKEDEVIKAQPCWAGICTRRLHMNETPPRSNLLALWANHSILQAVGRIKQGLDPKSVTIPAEIVEWPNSDARMTKLTLRCDSHETHSELRCGYEWERVVDWAEKTWGVRDELTKMTLSGED
jgi:hypothetical protein